MKEFKDKVVVITGAGSGIGRATAMAFASEGAKLYITDINQGRVEAVANEIKAMGAEATPYVVDSANREAMKKFADDVFASAGRVDILHNNAGIATGCTIDKTPLEDWEKVINVNLWGKPRRRDLMMRARRLGSIRAARVRHAGPGRRPPI